MGAYGVIVIALAIAGVASLILWALLHWQQGCMWHDSEEHHER